MKTMIRMMTVALMLAALALPAAQAQNVDSLWAQAVSDYTEENYRAALDGLCIAGPVLQYGQLLL